MAKKYDITAIRTTGKRLSIYDNAQESTPAAVPDPAPAPAPAAVPVKETAPESKAEKKAAAADEVRTTVVLPADLRSKLDMLLLQESVKRGKKITLKELFAEVLTDYITKQL